MLQDIRFALRLLSKNLGFAIVAIATLGIAVAANTVVFSIVNAILIRPLPFPESQRLIRVHTKFPEYSGDSNWNMSVHEYVELSRETRTFESVGAWVVNDANLTGGGRPVVVTVGYATASLLPTLGVPPMLGRFFDSSEDIPVAGTVDGYGSTRAIVLGYGLFTSAFGGDRNVIGRTVKVNAMPATVVGIMPRGFEFPEGAQMWMPLGVDMTRMNRGSHWYNVIGRVKAGLDIQAARAEMTSLMTSWAEVGKGRHRIDPAGHRIELQPLQEEVVGPVRLALLTLEAAVVFVLLIACANISNLLLARAEARGGEIAVRVALGASRTRMVRQFLTESLVLGLAGGGAGILFAMWGLDAVLALLPEGVPRAAEVRLDWTVLTYAIAVALGTSFVFGLTPIFHTGGDLAGTLRAAGQRTTGGRNKQLFRRALILLQVALAIVLVTGAGLMIRSFVRLQKTELGFDPRGLVTLNLQLPKAAYRSDEEVIAFWTRLREGALHLPGVKSATLAGGLPPLRPVDANGFTIAGRINDPISPKTSVDYWQYAGDDYFGAMGIPLIRGRLFDGTDHENAPKVVLINESMAKRFWPDEDPIGKRVRLTSGAPPGESAPEQTIIGIVGDVKQGGVDAKVGTEVYIPLRQTATWKHFTSGGTFTPYSMNLVLRTDGDPRALFGSVRAYVTSLDAGLPIARLQTMDRIVYDAIAKPRFVTTLLTAFAGVALLMAAIGIYGVMSYSVERRTKELSIRMALGADAGRLQKMLVLEGLELAGIGIALGLAVTGVMTLALEHWVARLLFDVGGLDPATYALVIVVTSGVAALASYIPARRATHIHPMTAMRHE